MKKPKPLPPFMTLTEAGMTVTLSKPTVLGGVQQSHVSMRIPAVRDVRVANAAADYDEEEAEYNLLCALTGISEQDIDVLGLKDLERLKESYLSLVREDEGFSKDGPLPSFLQMTDDGAVITLSRPAEMNGTKVDSLLMRAPTVRYSRAATRAAEGDSEKRELILFSSLAEVGTSDLEAMPVKDYTRLQRGYFRLLREDRV